MKNDETQITSFSENKSPAINIRNGDKPPTNITEKNGEHNAAFEKDSMMSLKDQQKEPTNEIEKNEAMQGNDSYAFKANGEVVESKEVEPQLKDVVEFEELPNNSNSCMKAIARPITAFTKFIADYKSQVYMIFFIFLALGVTAYMIAACVTNFNRAIALLVIWCLVVAYKIYALIRDNFGDGISIWFKPIYSAIKENMFWIKWVFIAVVVAGLATWIGLDTSKRPKQLISALGYIVFLFGIFITSKYPDRVIWRPVLWGLLIQICFGMFILRTQAGFDAFTWFGELAQTFINYVDAGAIFLFGDNFAEHYFAFKVLPIIIYFSSFISVLYHLGAMEWLILKMAWLMQISLNTSATESMTAAGNIVVGVTESPLLIRPYMKDLTPSEINAVMTAGFGTIAGSVLGAYLSFGIQPVYVITACIMAAPCALAVAKLTFPETKVSRFRTMESLKLERMGYLNVVDAAAEGAALAIPLVLNIGGVLIAFVSLLAAINGFLSWFGGLLDFPSLSFELMCSYVFVPVTYLMGIEWQDCFKCAELIGVKIFLTEFIAYEDLAEIIKLRDSGTIPKFDPNTGMANWIDERSEALITYALCGFANVASIGIMLGGLGSLVPARRPDLVKTVFRALMAGIFVSILNACVAGFLYVPRPIVCDNMLAATDWTSTEPSRLLECCTTALISPKYNMTVDCSCCSYNWNATDYLLNCSLINCFN